MISDLFYRFRSLFRRNSVESELNDELQFHIENETEKLIRAGLTPAEAARRAQLAFGFRDQVTEQCRDQRGTAFVENFVRDVLYAGRLLRINPTFTAVALLSLALGIGANTAIFQLLDAVRLRDLPVTSPGELHEVLIGGDGPSGNFTSRYARLSAAQWDQLQTLQQAYSSIGAWSARPFNLASGGETRPAEGILVSGRFFETLGVSAARGRVLDAGDDQRGCGTPVAVISDSFWKREFGGAPDAVGRALRLDGHPVTIVGITPASFFGVEVGRSYDIAIPLCAEQQLKGVDSQLVEKRNNYWLSAIGRLRPGWTVDRADAHLRTISKPLFAASLPADASPDQAKRYKDLVVKSQPAGKGLSWLRVNYERALWLLLGSAALVLLVACGNLANLLLARATARTHEIAVRMALGASRGRLVRQLLTESLMLASLGAGLGLLLAGVVSQSLVSFLITADDRVALRTNIDLRVLAFSMAVALSTCLLFGLAPALWASRVEANSAFAGARRASASRGRAAFRSFLVAAQVALSLVLVAGALLFGRSLFKLLSSDVGFRPEAVLVTSLDTRRLQLNEERQKVLFATLLERLRAIPGVAQAAQSTIIPMSGWESNTSIDLGGGKSIHARFSPVSSGYFATLGTPLLAGRDFGQEDSEKAQPVAIVNAAFAQKYFPGTDAVGQTFPSPFADKKICRIVGIVKNTKYVSLQETFTPIVFFPATQLFFTENYARYVVRSQLPPSELTRAIRETVASVSPSIDIEFIRLDQQLRESIVRERLLAALAGGFGLLAGFLAAVGLYGVLSYSVATRRSEIGIRMALGADRAMVMCMVLSEAGWLLGLGAAAGIVGTLAAGRAASTLLYGLQPNDPLTLLIAVAALGLVGLASSYLPARQASRLDPITALRQE